MESKSVLYVNFAPQENTGNILTYLTNRFEYVGSVCFDFHRLGKRNRSSTLTIYGRGRVVTRGLLASISIPQQAVFWLLPLRSLLIVVQLIAVGWKLAKLWGKIDYFFSVNAFTTCVGMALKKIGIVKDVIFWVWDYYPPKHESTIVSAMRSIYWTFDKLAAGADRVVFLNKRLWLLRKSLKSLKSDVSPLIVPIGTIKVAMRKRARFNFKLVFMGALKKGQGLDIWLKDNRKLAQAYPQLSLQIVGSGPDEEYFKKLARSSHIKVKFLGYLDDAAMVDTISRADLGIATYSPDPNNVSYFGDPSKIKYYLSCGIPVITTNAFEFSKQIKQHKAGEVIDYNKPSQLIHAIETIRAHYSQYTKQAFNLGKSLNYKYLYEGFFASS